MSHGITYKLTSILHGVPAPVAQSGQYVADGADENFDFMNRLDLESHVRSGDYLPTLATRLDDIASRLNRGDELPHEEIDRLVNDLLYIDRYYHLTRKS